MQLSKVHVTLIAFETLKQPDGVDAFISARRKSPADIAKEVAAVYQPVSSAGPSRRRCLMNLKSKWDHAHRRDRTPHLN